MDATCRQLAAEFITQSGRSVPSFARASRNTFSLRTVSTAYISREAWRTIEQAAPLYTLARCSLESSAAVQILTGSSMEKT